MLGRSIFDGIAAVIHEVREYRVAFGGGKHHEIHRDLEVVEYQLAIIDTYRLDQLPEGKAARRELLRQIVDKPAARQTPPELPRGEDPPTRPELPRGA